MLLVLTMVVLLALSSLAAASLVSSLLERSRVRSQANAVVALNAAEAGVAAGMAWLSDPDRYDPAKPDHLPQPYTADVNWRKTLPVRTLSGGGTYQVTLSFKRERVDRNGDGDCCDRYPEVPADEDSEYRDHDANLCTDCPGDVVLYNAGTGDGRFGFAGSYFSGSTGDEGYPVVEIDAVGNNGAGALREILLDVARNNKAQIEGAYTSRSGVTVGGSAKIDGKNYGAGGTGTSSCGGDLPGVTVDVGATAPPCGSSIVSGTGVPCSENFDPAAPGNRELGKTPWDVLGLSETDFRSLFSPPADAPSGNVTQPCSSSPYNLWFTSENGVKLNNASACASYSGVLVVHNEHFDPDVWAAQCAGGVTGTPPCVAANAPATLDMSGGVTWTGVVIADRVSVTGNPTIIGGLFTLASAGSVSSSLGNVSIKYSCDAVQLATRAVGYKKKIGWQRLR